MNGDENRRLNESESDSEDNTVYDMPEGYDDPIDIQDDEDDDGDDEEEEGEEKEEEGAESDFIVGNFHTALKSHTIFHPELVRNLERDRTAFGHPVDCADIIRGCLG